MAADARYRLGANDAWTYTPRSKGGRFAPLTKGGGGGPADQASRSAPAAPAPKAKGTKLEKTQAAATAKAKADALTNEVFAGEPTVAGHKAASKAHADAAVLHAIAGDHAQAEVHLGNVDFHNKLAAAKHAKQSGAQPHHTGHADEWEHAPDGADHLIEHPSGAKITANDNGHYEVTYNEHYGPWNGVSTTHETPAAALAAAKQTLEAAKAVKAANGGLFPGQMTEPPKPEPSPQPTAATASTSGTRERHIPDWIEAHDSDVQFIKDELPHQGENTNEIHTVEIDTPDGPMRAVWKPVAVHKKDKAHSEGTASSLSRYMFGEAAPVPPTVVREIKGRYGSMQAYVVGAIDGAAHQPKIQADPLKYATVPSARAIFLMDVISRNTDRKPANIMWTYDAKGQPVAHGIDNGCAFRHADIKRPFKFGVDDSLAYMKAQLHLDAHSKAVLKTTDMAETARLLKEGGIPEEARKQALTRLRVLKNEPDVLKLLVGKDPASTTANMNLWLNKSPAEHGLSYADIDEINLLASQH